MPTHLLPPNASPRAERREPSDSLDRFLESVRKLEEFVERGPRQAEAGRVQQPQSNTERRER
jgi:hypothetical protein